MPRYAANSLVGIAHVLDGIVEIGSSLADARLQLLLLTRIAEDPSELCLPIC